tara:strand:- start:870 stop:2057 length:1188 start_codon:yes stop_codon:yes gene_type:complete
MSHDFGQIKTPTVYLDFTNYFIHSGGVLTSASFSGEQAYGRPNFAQKFAYLDPYNLQQAPALATPGDDLSSEQHDMVIGYGFGDTNNNKNYLNNINYCAILGHEIDSTDKEFAIMYRQSSTKFIAKGLYDAGNLNVEPITSGGDADTTFERFAIPKFGSSIIKLNDMSGDLNGIALVQYKSDNSDGSQHSVDRSNHFRNGIGALSFGEYFKFPQSPDLSVSITRDFDFIEHKTNLAGKSYSTVTNNGAKFGHGTQPFSIYQHDSDNGLYDDSNAIFSRVGRRIWDVSFSQLAADDVFHAYESFNYSNDDIRNDTNIKDGTNDISTWEGAPILFDNPIMKLYTMTHAGRLPFIWQPDSDDNTPQGFALCKLESKSFSVVQESFGRYSFELQIKEVW